jgi:hypothetical protein
MKIRNNFVSNSSSSSFIVAVDNITTKITLSMEIDLANYAHIINSIDDLDNYYFKEWICGYNTIEEWLKDEDDSWVHEQYKKSKKALENGKKVLIGYSDGTGDAIGAMLCNNGLKGIVGNNVEIIYSEGGY